LEKSQNDQDKTHNKLRQDFEAYVTKNDDKVKSNYDEIIARLDSHDARIKALEEEVAKLNARPIGNTSAAPVIDYDALTSKDEFLSLLERVKLVEKRNLEQDDRLTDNELRIEKLEKMISDPLERIQALEMRCDNITLELNNKVSVQDMYNEMLKKADLNGLKALEASLIRLNDLINDLAN